jgi:hypothetical protein
MSLLRILLNKNMFIYNYQLRNKWYGTESNMGEKKIISIVLFVLLITLIPLTVAAENQTESTSVSAGYGQTIMFGIFPEISGDTLRLFAILPPFGNIAIAKPRFTGHIGIILVYGEYQWFADGPPAIITNNR